MGEAITSWGKYASSISAIIALLTLVLWKPIQNARKRHKQKKADEEEFRKKVLHDLDGIKSVVESTRDDVADLQCDRLNQAHDYWIERGYCPTDTKNVLCKMYKSYHGKDRNHLTVRYEEDILELPNEPQERFTKGETA
jgi:hypothetical protein